MHGILIELILLLGAAVVIVPLFKALKLGAILAYLFAGVLIGPEVFRFVSNPESILHLSELGVVFLLFIIGLELQPTRLWKMRRDVFGLGLLQVLVTGGALTAAFYLLQLPLNFAFIAGFGLSLSSTAFGIQILEEKHQLKTTHGQGSFSILLFQDLAVVPLLALLPFLTASGGQLQLASIGKGTLIVVAFVIFGLYFVRHILSFIAKSRTQEVFTASSLLLVLGSAVVMEKAGLSMGTGAFLAGVLLANSEYRHELEVNLQPFKGLLLGLFFMAVGMTLKLNVILESPHIVAALVVGFMIVKSGVIYALARVFQYPKESARNMAATLPQGGEFAFVLFSVAATHQIFSADQAALFNAAVTISMALTPLVFFLNQKYMRTFSEISERPYDTITSEDAQVIVAGFGRFGQIVSRFLTTQGVTHTILEHSAAQVDTARKFGNKIYYGDASREDLVHAAGAHSAKIFVLAIDDVDVSVATAKMVIHKFPHLKIIARVRNRNHAIQLIELGVTDIFRETYFSSLEVAKDVFLKLGGSESQANSQLQLFRKHDESILKRQFELRNDEKAMISMTAAANAELEKILKSDLAEQ